MWDSGFAVDDPRGGHEQFLLIVMSVFSDQTSLGNLR